MKLKTKIYWAPVFVDDTDWTINGYQMLKFQAEESWNLWHRK